MHGEESIKDMDLKSIDLRVKTSFGLFALIAATLALSVQQSSGEACAQGHGLIVVSWWSLLFAMGLQGWVVLSFQKQMAAYGSFWAARQIWIDSMEKSEKAMEDVRGDNFAKGITGVNQGISDVLGASGKYQKHGETLAKITEDSRKTFRASVAFYFIGCALNIIYYSQIFLPGGK